MIISLKSKKTHGLLSNLNPLTWQMLDNFFTGDVVTSGNRNVLLLKDTDSIIDG